MYDTCLDVAAGKNDKRICYRGHYQDNWGNMHMGYLLSGSIVSVLKFLSVITALQLCRRMSFPGNHRLQY